MKAIDFTKPGGFPLSQDQLGYLQTAYTEGIQAIAATGANSSAAVRISGMVSSTAGGTTTVAAGWLFYNGELVRFVGDSYGTVGTGNDVYVVLTAGAATLTYNDGSTPAVVLDKTAALAILPDTTPTDATHFLLKDLKPYGWGLGINNREQTWQSLAVSTDAAVGGVTGTIYYKKDHAANTLQIRGLLVANNAQNFAASPGSLFYLMGTIDNQYWPNNGTFFMANFWVASMIKDDLGIAWIKQVNCGINTAGQIFINWIRPDIAIAGYGITFNAILPLD